MLKWQLGPALRRDVASRMRRNSAFHLTLESRNIIRRTIKYFTTHYPETMNTLKVLPISSTDWTSEYRTSGNSDIIVIDFEQINALRFSFALRSKLEHPIFHFIEFNIRASELLLGLRRPEAAKQLANASLHFLRQYSQIHGDSSSFPRPISIDGLTTAIPVIEHIIPSFIIGHEFGHHAYGERFEPIIAALKDTYEATEKTATTFDGGPAVTFAHVGIDTEYTIDNARLFGTAQRQLRHTA